MFIKILSDTDLLVLESEGHRGGVVGEVDVVDRVRSAVTPVSDDNLLTVLCSYCVLPLVGASVLLL